MKPNSTEKTIAIVGGGASGVLAAYQVAQKKLGVRIPMIDPNPEPGLGLAYSTPSFRHLLNVPAGKISALQQEPNHFLDWLRINYDPDATPMTFAPRAIFGRYLQSVLALARNVEHVRASATDIELSGSSAILTLGDKREVRADQVILATGNFDPAALPGISDRAQTCGVYKHNAWRAETYLELETNDPVTLIGTGLTAVDVVLRLRELGHRGLITAVSRHGFFPHHYLTYQPIKESAISAGTSETCVAYLRVLRRCIRNGAEWRAAVDSVRDTANDLWLALPLKEQKRFRRHLQRRWDVVRHRMAPPIANLIEAELATGTLVIREGRLIGVEAIGDGAKVTIRTQVGIESFATARVINCTGPGMNYRSVHSPLLDSLFARGLVTPGPIGGGFNCTRSGAMVSADGSISKVLFNLGPGRLGTLFESIAIPEIRDQASELASLIATQFEMPESQARERNYPASRMGAREGSPAREAAWAH